MMDQSRRARRMARHHNIRKQPVLNLVSLMDIFTILVFFLLVSSSNSQQLPNKKDLTLPTSIAKKVPDETLAITITPQQILVDGRKVAEISAEISSDDRIITGLLEELAFRAKGRPALPEGRGFPITIVGDENIPYELLRKIMSTCREANYTRIAFAAIQKSAPKVQ